ncbi:MAG: hypothetical protein HYS62_02190 [Candidatus Aenigmarchaeota archaeon]|nr:hypothetical protein [Candidatus Aenigmarchaeota archaeon]
MISCTVVIFVTVSFTGVTGIGVGAGSGVGVVVVVSLDGVVVVLVPEDDGVVVDGAELAHTPELQKPPVHSFAAEHDAPSDFKALVEPIVPPVSPEEIVIEDSPCGAAMTIGTNKMNTAKNAV